MDWINGFLNLTAPPLTLFALLHLLPQWHHIKYWLVKLGSVFSEDIAGKVVLITGASSGIGEHLAYEYASRGACLALAAMRENRLREVADRCLQIGSPEVVTQQVDVANINDCRHFIDQAVNHFGRLDHLVNNAGISQVSMLEEIDDITIMRLLWILTSGAQFTLQGSLLHIAETLEASKAAKAQFFETLRVEFGSDIKITIATPGLLESELTQVKFLSGGGEMEVDPDMRDVQFSLIPVGKAEACARAIVNRACKGERDVTEPAWIRMAFLWKLFWPEVIEWTQRLILMTMDGDSAKDNLGKEI